MASILSLDMSLIGMRKRREMIGDKSLYGVVNAGDPRVLNFTTETLAGVPEFVRSGQGNQSRLPGPRRRVYVGSSGPINMELAPGDQMNEMIEDGMCDPFTADVAVAGVTIDADDSDNSLNGSVGNEFANILPGGWYRIDGFVANSGENNTDGAAGRPYGAYVVSKPNDGKIILAYHTLVTEAAGPSVTVRGKTCRNGTSLISSTYERDQSDATVDRYQHYPGCVVESWDLSFQFNSIITAVFALTGMAPRGAGGLPNDGTSGKSALSVWDGQTDITESFVRTIGDASNNMRAFRDGGVLSGNVKQFDISHGNNVEPIQLAQVTDPCGQSLGTASLTGTLNGVLLDNDSRVIKAFNSESTDFHVQVIPDAVAFSPTVPIYVVTLYAATFNELGDSPKTAITGPSPLDLAFECDESPDYPNVWYQIAALPSEPPP